MKISHQVKGTINKFDNMYKRETIFFFFASIKIILGNYVFTTIDD